MKQVIKILANHADKAVDSSSRFLEPTVFDDDILPFLRDISVQSKGLRILVTHEYSYFPSLNGFVTDLSPQTIWNLSCAIQYYHSEHDYDDEGLDDIQLIYLLCRFNGCIPFSGAAKNFDCKLDMFWNWEGGFLNHKNELFKCQLGIENYLSPMLKREIERISQDKIKLISPERIKDKPCEVPPESCIQEEPSDDNIPF
jgi:hypothetical protein